jgi:hypothetical protein
MGTVFTVNRISTTPGLRFVPTKGGFILPRKADYTGPPWNPHVPIFGTTIEFPSPCSTL